MKTKQAFDTCVIGQGIICGGKIQVQQDCSIQVSAGSAILKSGRVIHFPDKKFWHYFLESPLKETFRRCTGINNFFQLTEEEFNPVLMDDLKQQHPDDFPNHNFLKDKIVLIFFEETMNPDCTYFLVPKWELASVLGGPIVSKEEKPMGIFGKKPGKRKLDEATLEAFFRPEITLPQLSLPRFGYYQLALLNPAKGLVDQNLANPYLKISSYKAIFFEYKAIIDTHIYQIKEAIDLLHSHFGSVLSHKGPDYLVKFAEVLIAKWQYFCREGESLYYIQYIYDWLCDIIQAYEELRVHLTGFKALCVCQTETFKKENGGSIILLGPIFRANTTYKPIIFRSEFQEPVSEKDLKKIRFFHWRMMMMIWTFDLPFLGLERVLYNFGFDPGIEEELDSTNYWEWTDTNKDGEFNLEDLPIKATPTFGPKAVLSLQAIPYYFPLDSNSVYSIHWYWNFQKYQDGQEDRNLSFNAHLDDPNKSSTDVTNDSYSNLSTTILPLAYNLKDYKRFRVEGQIGKKIQLREDNGKMKFHFPSFSLRNYLLKYNLGFEVIAVELSKVLSNQPVISYLTGIDRDPNLNHHETLVLVFIDNFSEGKDKGEQIELDECNQEDLPKVNSKVVLADFWLPYKYSCCGKNIDGIYELGENPARNQ